MVIPVRVDKKGDYPVTFRLYKAQKLYGIASFFFSLHRAVNRLFLDRRFLPGAGSIQFSGNIHIEMGSGVCHIRLQPEEPDITGEDTGNI